MNENQNKLILKIKNDIDPILELYRGKIYCQIIKMFIYLITNSLGTEILNQYIL